MDKNADKVVGCVPPYGKIVGTQRTNIHIKFDVAYNFLPRAGSVIKEVEKPQCIFAFQHTANVLRRP